MFSLIQRPAPDFTVDAVMSNGDFGKVALSEYKDKKYVVLFFYPLDFTFVCPTEILSFSNRAQEFESRGVQLIGMSVDSKFSHYAWRNTPVEKGGIGAIRYPLASDITKEVARDYGVLINDAVSLRATFLIDKQGIVRHATLNDLPLGRDVSETLRLVDALQTTEQTGDVCPAGWKKGLSTMQPTTAGMTSYLKEFAAQL